MKTGLTVASERAAIEKPRLGRGLSRRERLILANAHFEGSCRIAPTACGPEWAGKLFGGVLHALTDWAGKLFGNGGASAALAKLTSLGFSADQVKSFVPNLLAHLKGKLPPEAMKQISGLLPVSEEAAAGTPA